MYKSKLKLVIGILSLSLVFNATSLNLVARASNLDTSNQTLLSNKPIDDEWTSLITGKINSKDFVKKYPNVIIEPNVFSDADRQRTNLIDGKISPDNVKEKTSVHIVDPVLSDVSDNDMRDVLNGKIAIQAFLKKYPKIAQQKSQKSIAQNQMLSVSSTSTLYNAVKNTFSFIPNSTYYGTSQMWFSGSDADLTNYGCGSATADNIMIYHARNYSRPNLYTYADYRYDFVKSSVHDMFYGFVGGVCFLSDMESGIKRYANSKNVTGYADSSVTCSSASSAQFQSLVNLIKNSVDSNNPVAFLIGPEVGSNGYQSNFSTHWVTITAYKYENGKYYISFSSWGNLYTWTLELSQLVSNRLFISAASFYK